MLGVTALRALGVMYVLPIGMQREMDRVLETNREASMEREAATKAVLDAVRWSLSSVDVCDETRALLITILNPNPHRRPSAHVAVKESGRLIKERLVAS